MFSFLFHICTGNSLEQIKISLRQLNSEQLLSYNPRLVDYTPATRIAYARFKGIGLQDIKDHDDERFGDSLRKKLTKLLYFKNFLFQTVTMGERRTEVRREQK